MARRSLAYGPDFRRDAGDDREDRGVMFMAYNASIAEQFEIIQRWMSGGNTPADRNGTGCSAANPIRCSACPTRTARGSTASSTRRPRATGDLGATPFVTLQWGLYLFVPSINALRCCPGTPTDLPTSGLAGTCSRTTSHAKSEDRGDDWAALLSRTSPQTSGITAAVCAAIRAEHQRGAQHAVRCHCRQPKVSHAVLPADPVFSVRVSAEVSDFCWGKLSGMDRGRVYESCRTGEQGILMIKR